MLIDEVRISVRNRINLLSDWILKNGEITYGGIQFSMGDSDKYFQEFILVPDAYYPYGIKGIGSDWLTFQTKADYGNFIGYGMQQVQVVLFWGRTLKDGGAFGAETYKSLAEMTLEELQNFIDPREQVW